MRDERGRNTSPVVPPLAPRGKGKRARDKAGEKAKLGHTSMDHLRTVDEKAEPELRKAIKQGKIPIATGATLAKELTKEEQLKVAAEPERAKAVANNIKRQSKREKIIALTTASVEHPEGTFAVVYADPPWEYEDTG